MCWIKKWGLQTVTAMEVVEVSGMRQLDTHSWSCPCWSEAGPGLKLSTTPQARLVGPKPVPGQEKGSAEPLGLQTSGSWAAPPYSSSSVVNCSEPGLSNSAVGLVADSTTKQRVALELRRERFLRQTDQRQQRKGAFFRDLACLRPLVPGQQAGPPERADRPRGTFLYAPLSAAVSSNSLTLWLQLMSSPDSGSFASSF